MRRLRSQRAWFAATGQHNRKHLKEIESLAQPACVELVSRMFKSGLAVRFLLSQGRERYVEYVGVEGCFRDELVYKMTFE